MKILTGRDIGCCDAVTLLVDASTRAAPQMPCASTIGDELRHNQNACVSPVTLFERMTLLA
jgi:hypothetical protein